MQKKNSDDTLDLHGYKYEEALSELDRFINNAIMNRIESVKIIHGKGTGILKEAVCNYLENSELVLSFESNFPYNCFGTTSAYLIKI